MARMNISVPEEMRSEITRLGDRVNWSGLAQEAFARAIQTLKIPTEPSMENVIERLRSTKAESDGTERANGVEAGKQFAMEHASYAELKTVDHVDPDDSVDIESFMALFERTLYEKDYFFGEETPDEPYIQGFIEGMQLVWEEVKDQI